MMRKDAIWAFIITFSSGFYLGHQTGNSLAWGGFAVVLVLVSACRMAYEIWPWRNRE